MEDINTIITDLKNAFLPNLQHELQAIVLIGGACRDLRLSIGWSDLDVIVVWKDKLKNYSKIISNGIKFIEKKHNIRVDITQVYVDELYDNIFSVFFYDGIVLNAIKRNECHLIVYGELPILKISDSQEIISALNYLSSVRLWQREYVLEKFYNSNHNKKDALPKLIRRTFSIIRASLRLFGIFSHPYEDSLKHIFKLYPHISLKLPNKLLLIRNNYESYEFKSDDNLIDEIINFNEKYIRFILAEYNKKEGISEKHN